jgi:hypothetical protein
VALDHVDLLGAALSIFFRDALSDGEKALLDAVISVHSGMPLPETALPITVVATPPFGSKTIGINGVTKHLYARYAGFQASLVTGSNILTYAVSYPWVKMLGIEAINCEALDIADLEILDTATGTYSGHPNAVLNQFGYSINLPANYYRQQAEFDVDLYSGMVVRLTYTSISDKMVGVNLLMNECK